MTGFISKRLSREAKLGSRLKALREESGVKLGTLAADLRVSERYLEDLEEGRYHALSEEIYVRNFIRSYAHAFGRDSAPFLDLCALELVEARGSRKIERTVPSVLVRKLDLLPTVFVFRVILASVVSLAFLFYLGYEVKKITSPPTLIIEEPADNLVINFGEIVVRGRSEKEAQIRINGEQALGDSAGNFKEIVRLERGLNLIKISAAKRRSKERVVWRRVVYEEAVALK